MWKLVLLLFLAAGSPTARAIADDSSVAVQQGNTDPVTEERLLLANPANNPVTTAEPSPGLAVLCGLFAVAVFHRMRQR